MPGEVASLVHLSTNTPPLDPPVSRAPLEASAGGARVAPLDHHPWHWLSVPWTDLNRPGRYLTGRPDRWSSDWHSCSCWRSHKVWSIGVVEAVKVRRCWSIMHGLYIIIVIIIYIYIKDLDAFMFTGLTVHGIFMTLEGCSGHAVGWNMVNYVKLTSHTHWKDQPPFALSETHLQAGDFPKSSNHQVRSNHLGV